MKSNLNWYETAWHLGSTTPLHHVPLQTPLNTTPTPSDVDWYATAWLLGTTAELDAADSRSSLTSTLAATWHRLLAWLSVSSDPQVWTRTDASGQVTWNAYDPISGRTVSRLTQDDMMAWLEERYYQ